MKSFYTLFILLLLSPLAHSAEQTCYASNPSSCNTSIPTVTQITPNIDSCSPTAKDCDLGQQFAQSLFENSTSPNSSRED